MPFLPPNQQRQSTEASSVQLAHLQLVEDVDDGNDAKAHVGFGLVEGEIKRAHDGASNLAAVQQHRVHRPWQQQHRGASIYT